MAMTDGGDAFTAEEMSKLREIMGMDFSGLSKVQVEQPQLAKPAVEPQQANDSQVVQPPQPDMAAPQPDVAPSPVKPTNLAGGFGQPVTPTPTEFPVPPPPMKLAVEPKPATNMAPTPVPVPNQEQFKATRERQTTTIPQQLPATIAEQSKLVAMAEQMRKAAQDVADKEVAKQRITMQPPPPPRSHDRLARIQERIDGEIRQEFRQKAYNEIMGFNPFLSPKEAMNRVERQWEKRQEMFATNPQLKQEYYNQMQQKRLAELRKQRELEQRKRTFYPRNPALYTSQWREKREQLTPLENKAYATMGSWIASAARRK